LTGSVDNVVNINSTSNIISNSTKLFIAGTTLSVSSIDGSLSQDFKSSSIDTEVVLDSIITFGTSNKVFTIFIDNVVHFTIIINPGEDPRVGAIKFDEFVVQLEFSIIGNVVSNIDDNTFTVPAKVDFGDVLKVFKNFAGVDVADSSLSSLDLIIGDVGSGSLDLAGVDTLGGSSRGNSVLVLVQGVLGILDSDGSLGEGEGQEGDKDEGFEHLER